MKTDTSAIRDRCRFVRQARPVFVAIIFILHPSSFILAKGPARPGEPTEGYYKAEGRGIGVRWEVEPKTVHVGSDLTATLVITGAQNPTEIVKPDLRKLKPFDAFKITDVAGPPREAKAKEVRFAYKLAPRSVDVKKVPALEFRYFNPAAAPGKTQFPSTRTDREVEALITVIEPPKAVRVVKPLEAPEFLFHPATGPDARGRGPFAPCRWAWLAMAFFGPLAAFAWFLAWRRVYPDAVRLARVRRSRAARRAVALIRKATNTPDPPATVANAVLGYLRTRFPLPESAVTPSEIAAALVELNVPKDVAEQTGDVFRACDRARFAPASDNGLSLAAGAETAVARLEALA